MADIEQEFVIQASPQRVFDGVSRPALLDQWWTLRSSGQPTIGAAYALDFGPEYSWRAVVTRSVPGEAFELRMTEADPDWESTLVGFTLTPTASGTQVRFHHRYWPVANEHFRISAHCWALYLRILRRHLEHGEVVPYDRRLDA
ncbi:MAG: SRPBCC family protein [Gemmatimonadaceae bacterium]